MKHKLLKTLLLLGLTQTSLHAEDFDFLSFNGYGTLGAAFQDNKNVLHRDAFYSKGGSQGELSFDNYTVLGLQLDAEVTEKLNLTVQAIASKNNENGKMFDLEWANAKYEINDEFDVRVGLMRLPTFMFSDILHVAYSYDWVKLPDMYSTVSINKYTGIELSHRLNLNNFSIYSTLLYGETKSDIHYIQNGGPFVKSEVTADKIYGITSKVLYNNLSFRMAYIKANITMTNENVDTLLAQFNDMGIPSISSTIDTYKTENTEGSYLNAGARYDFENSYLLGEVIKVDSDSFLPDIFSWNVGAGYNFETWTPFALYSKTKNKSNYNAISAQGMPAQVAGAITGANQAFSAISSSDYLNVETYSLGFRYDLHENALLKFQYDEQERGKEKLHIFSTAINFVF